MKSSRFSAIFLILLVVFNAHGQITFREKPDLLEGVQEHHSGVAIGIVDLNGDGRDDLLRLSEGEFLSMAFAQNSGRRFDVRELGTFGEPWAICAADVNADSFNDILLATDGGGLHVLRSEQGSSGYVSNKIPDSEFLAQGTIFADLDGDGILDIFACDDDSDLRKYRGTTSGTFVPDQRLALTGLGGDHRDSGNYAVIMSDVDNDGDSDFYVSKCSRNADSSTDPRRVNRLLRNDGPRNYVDVGADIDLADGEQSWCADFGDIDNDGDLDCFVLNHHFPPSSHLFENDGTGRFTDITGASGLNDRETMREFGIQALFRDFDNDGYVDLLIGDDSGYGLFRNRGDKTFVALPESILDASGLPVESLHTFAVGDLNHDGFLDLYGGRGTGENTPGQEGDLLLINAGNPNRSIMVHLTGHTPNASAVGARVEVHSSLGVQVREVRAGEGYGIMNSLTQHFGMRDLEKADRVIVRWPSGEIDEFNDVLAGRRLFIVEGQTRPKDTFKIPILNKELTVTATVGVPFALRVLAENLPTRFALGSTSAEGIGINPASGVVTWLPRSPGNFVVSVIASNPAGSATGLLRITVAENPLNDAAGFSGASPLTTSARNPWSVVSDSSATDGNALRSAFVGNEEFSTIETEIAGPDFLLFDWKVSSERNADFLEVAVDGVKEQGISGETVWQEASIYVPPGSHSVSWIYRKDGSDSLGTDAGWIDNIRLASESGETFLASAGQLRVPEGGRFAYQLPLSTRGSATVSVMNLPAALAHTRYGSLEGIVRFTGIPEIAIRADDSRQWRLQLIPQPPLSKEVARSFAPQLNAAFSFSGAPWSTAPEEAFGKPVITSGGIGDLGSSVIDAVVIGPGEASFQWRVSSEGEFDGLEFALDGKRIARITGETPWQELQLQIPPGTHGLRWAYRKDEVGSEGSDAGFLTDLVLTGYAGWSTTIPNDLSHAYDADIDGDGTSNLVEYASGSDPLIADYRPLIEPVYRFDDRTVSLQMVRSLPDHVFVTLFEFDGSHEGFRWTRIPLSALSEGRILHRITGVAQGASSGIYRLEVSILPPPHYTDQ